ncbi:MAG: UDP-N-acetylmuramate dehydrogenase [Candidatus Pacebacteria bacterium]|jgi:UDP-N-acetylmuramate dehydrogenase|nr:UDP-N-acetylmuramate dehydrogenase [Candidatus Paceibacterota bacterium]MDP7159363.1 UDP-N-acetylmuramate dehydrogenase [Candidatus Paceibacterota bacterium]MDP7466504.1 UDP-N-acetylmuramate dehydrogenase [Candidatus Paceibacterota bacterium]
MNPVRNNSNKYSGKNSGEVISYRMNIKQNVPLKNLTTFKVGGCANYFCKVKSVSELKEAVDFSKKNSLQVFVLGGGSNILVSDSGFNGLVIKIEIKGISYEDEKAICGAGENWDRVVESSIQNKLYGIENLSFIPGTVGGAVAGNIGAYGMEIKDNLEWVEVFDTKNLKTIILKKSECKFDYRDSIFKKNNFIITKICLKLSYEENVNLSYKDIKEYFKNNNTPKLKKVRSAIGKIRKNKFPDLKKYGTAGSFFKNPVIEGNKIHLAKILDNLDMKGLREGSIGISEKQPLIIINYGSASAKDVKTFSEKVAHKVYKKTKIKITPEIIFVGKF